MPRGPKHVGCSVQDCDRKHYAKTYCQKHYAMNAKYGTPTPVKTVVNCTECGEKAYARELCHRHYQAWYYHNRLGSGAQRGWYKEEVGYYGAHNRIRAVRGRANSYGCVLCGENATDWALSVDAGDLRYASMSEGRKPTAYSLNVYDYLPMCSNCHKAYDAEHGMRNYKTGKYARAGREVSA